MLRVAVLLAFVLACIGSAEAEERVALVIGNGAYRSLTALPNPPADAAAVAARLRGLGFAVTERADLDKQGMEDVIRQFGRQAAHADVAMVYYAGHGVQVGGRNYLVPVGAGMPEREQDLRYDFVDLATVLEELAGARRLRIVVLDACRDNPIAARLSRSLGRSLGADRGLAPPPSMDNTLVAYATAADATAADGNGPHSPFTTALLQHLEDRGLDIRLMFGRVRDEVRRQTDNRQNPFVYESLGGDSFAFNADPASGSPSAGPTVPTASLSPPPPPPPAPPPPQPQPLPQLQAMAAPNPLQRSPAKEAVPRSDWTSLLAGRWRMANGRPCNTGFGIATPQGGTIRFEWRLPNGRLNTAIEEINAEAGNVVLTTVLSDVGTPTPEVGHRFRYVFEPDKWTSQNLLTGERAVHLRC